MTCSTNRKRPGSPCTLNSVPGPKCRPEALTWWVRRSQAAEGSVWGTGVRRLAIGHHPREREDREGDRPRDGPPLADPVAQPRPRACDPRAFDPAVERLGLAQHAGAASTAVRRQQCLAPFVAHRAPPGYRIRSSAIAARYTAALSTPTARSARARLKCAHASVRSSYSSGGSVVGGKASPLSEVLHHRVDAAPLGEVVRQPHRRAEVPRAEHDDALGVADAPGAGGAADRVSGAHAASPANTRRTRRNTRPGRRR